MRIDRELQIAPSRPKEDPETFFPRYAEELSRLFAPLQSVSTAHVLLHAVSDPGTLTSQALALYYISARQIAVDIEQFTLEEEQDTKNSIHAAAAATPAADPLHRFGTDLTDEARAGRLDPVIGRDREIDRMVQILSRRKKNNPLLIGEAGVGKSALVEGLALRMAGGEVPPPLRGKRLFSLDLASLVAGTKYRGEFEERMQQLLGRLREKQDTILFIDEIHTIAGAGSTQGSLDTANILKPALARGELQFIGATTRNEYRSDLERDAALTRRFQNIAVEPPSAEETLRILRDVVPRYEEHHGVRYTDEALQRCVALAERYLPDRNFPDKAIDLLDEAGARIHLPNGHKAKSKESTEFTLQEPKRSRRSSSPHKKEKRDAEHDPHFRLTRSDERPEIRPEQIEQVVTSMTGIPAEQLSEQEQQRLQRLKEQLQQRVIGQEEAVEKVARAIQRSRAGLREEGRPIGVFLFVGPTGVGKTLLAKELSRQLFDECRGLIRIDMSEYGQQHNVARLIGAPPGYVGYGEGGQLTEAVRHHPYSVILLDEIEKAHPEIFDTLLQLLDEGRLTDGSGRVVDFRNTVIIMTSNAGSHDLASRTAPVGYSTPSRIQRTEQLSAEVHCKALEELFAPEFLNRIDEIVHFRRLTRSDVRKIIDLELNRLLDRAGRLGFRVEITPEAQERLTELGYDSRYGARALRRLLTRRIEDPLSGLIVEGRLRRGERVVFESGPHEEVTPRVA